MARPGRQRALGAVAALLALALSVPRAAHAQLDVPPEPILPTPPAKRPPPPPPQQQQPPAQPGQPPPPLPAALEPPLDEPPPPGSPYQSVVRGHRPSPRWTQDRNFTSTRFWLLDPGQVEFETWLRTRIFHELPDASGNLARAPAELLFQNEVEIGIFPHLQLDIYENLTFNVQDDGHRGVQQEGNQIELRVAIPSYYGQVFANPVIYLEWHPRHNQPDRAEVRLLLGGALSSRIYLAVNPYFETNVEETAGQLVMDAEVGATVALGVAVTSWLRLSGEVKIGGDMLGDPTNTFHFVAWAGPGFILKPLPGKLQHYLKIMGTCLIDLLPRNDPAIGPQQFEPLVIVGSQL
jgi:hypothetical protein